MWKKYIEELISRYPILECTKEKIVLATESIINSLEQGGTILCAGNGGSGADCEHIAGELLKGFRNPRNLSSEQKELFAQSFGNDGEILADKLQGALRCISLLSHPALASAYANDVDAQLIYAQQLFGLGQKGDIFLGISTGGNAINIKNAMMVAQIKGIKTILLTGNKKGLCEKYASIVIDVNESETYKIQELHLPIYHTISMAVEEYFFGEK